MLAGGRFDATAGGETSDRFRNIEARLEEISSRLDGASQPAGTATGAPSALASAT